MVLINHTVNPTYLTPIFCWHSSKILAPQANRIIPVKLWFHLFLKKQLVTPQTCPYIFENINPSSTICIHNMPNYLAFLNVSFSCQNITDVTLMLISLFLQWVFHISSKNSGKGIRRSKLSVPITSVSIQNGIIHWDHLYFTRQFSTKIKITSVFFT